MDFNKLLSTLDKFIKKKRRRIKKLLNQKRKAREKAKKKKPSRKKSIRKKARRASPKKKAIKKKDKAKAKIKKKVVKVKKRPVKKKVKKKAKKKSIKKAAKRTTKAKPVQKLKIDGEQIAVVTHYFSRIKVAVVKVTKGKMFVGDQIHILGKTSNFKQGVDSLQIESSDVPSATKGQQAGLKVKKKVRQGDKVFRLN